ncbi:Lrp/AsnC family transcriptional regulator [Halovivax limisalsi]|uniref:Lrp/AsnC family transcriptional regulator n=1 Tax=Halovivax limisalsi TaxID=1453760 RepID=UPI001FFCDEFD|nr:Lrp/AsnC family transcriptional regulator [Halovivax limisalsi]
MELDPTDRTILYLLQGEKGTSLTHDDIADRIDVSSSTVSNRIQQLKETDVLLGYRAKIDYENAGIPHRILFVCTAPISDRKHISEAAMDITHVVNVRELLTGTQNIHIEVVGTDAEDIETTTQELDELGLVIEHSEILRRELHQPFDDFGKDLADESS